MVKKGLICKSINPDINMCFYMFTLLNPVLMFVLFPADCCPLAALKKGFRRHSTDVWLCVLYVAFLLSDTQDHYHTHLDPCTLKDILATVAGFSYRLDSTIIHLQSANILGLNRSMMVCCNSKTLKWWDWWMTEWVMIVIGHCIPLWGCYKQTV